MNSLVRYNPRSLNVVDEFDKVFDSIFRTNGNRSSVTPVVDIREGEDSYTLEAELPGHTEKDVDVKIDDNLLTISSKVESTDEEKKEGYLVRERRIRSFNRSFVLPRDVDREKIEARYANGLLTLELHKTPESKPRQIEIKTGK